MLTLMLLLLLLLLLLGTGCFWVYRVFRPDADEDSPFYCDPTLYSYAFWLLTSLYIFLGAATLCLCCVSGTAFLITK